MQKINKIRSIIVQLEIRPDSIFEYDNNVVCMYGDNDLIFKIDNEHCIITLNNDHCETIKWNDLEYMNIVLSEYASRDSSS